MATWRACGSISTPQVQRGLRRSQVEADTCFHAPSPEVGVPLPAVRVPIPEWVGRCHSCDGWNTFVEERVVAAPKGRGLARAVRVPIALGDVPADAEERMVTGIGEFDRVLGGGIVQGSCVLLGGDPGIGKSSLLMQASAALATQGTVLYVSGEESAAQIKMRARRFDIASDGILVLSETDVGSVIEALRKVRPIFVVVDSIQTMNSDEIASGAGGVSQLRECTARLLELAKGAGARRDGAAWTAAQTPPRGRSPR